MNDQHPAAPHHLPGFITAPGDTDTLMVGVGIFLIVAVLMVGIFYLHLHTMPEQQRSHEYRQSASSLGSFALRSARTGSERSQQI